MSLEAPDRLVLRRGRRRRHQAGNAADAGFAARKSGDERVADLAAGTRDEDDRFSHA